MAVALILDSEALNALARPHQRAAHALRARAILRVAEERSALIRVPAPVLAELCRGTPDDAPIHRVLNGQGISIVPLAATEARLAGALLARAKMDSANAVDAFVVATAAHFTEAVIATGDPDDLRRLAANHRGITVFEL